MVSSCDCCEGNLSPMRSFVRRISSVALIQIAKASHKYRQLVSVRCANSPVFFSYLSTQIHTHTHSHTYIGKQTNKQVATSEHQCLSNCQQNHCIFLQVHATMVVQTYKNDLKEHRETETILEVDGCKLIRKTVKSKLMWKCLTGLLIFCLFCLHTSLMYYVLNKNNEIQQLQELVNTLTSDVNKLKFQYLDDDLVDEIKAFGNEAYSDSDSNDDTSTDDGDDEDEWTSYLDDDDFPEHNIDMNKFMKILTGDYDTSETPMRSKRELLSSTIDGVPIIAESYSERKRNKTLVTNADGLKLYESLGKKSTGEPPKVKHHYSGGRGWASRTYVHSRDLRPASPTPVMTRSSRVMHTNEDKPKAFRNVVKKSLTKSSAPDPTTRVFQEQVLAPEATVTREGTGVHRRRKHGSRANLETMDHPRAKRNMVLVHFHGDTSKYVYGQHQNYKNNGHLAHPEGRYVDWAPSNWVQTLGMDRHFQMNNGVLTIKDAGLYFVYAQIFYLDEHDTNGYKIVKNDRELIAQCTTMTHSERQVSKSNTCYTATVHYLAENDRVSLKDVENMRYSLFEDGKSFFGLVKINDIKLK